MDRTQIARMGGMARAARLTPARRSEIARMGWQALVAKRFGGDSAAAVRWLTARGLAAQDRELATGLASLGGSLRHQAQDPGPMPTSTADPED
jgi:hypothetical protein